MTRLCAFRGLGASHELDGSFGWNSSRWVRKLLPSEDA